MTDSAASAIIEDWAKVSGLPMRRARRGPGRYIFHKSNSRGECFQISIFPPRDSVVIIEIWSVETIDDRDMHRRWDVPVRDLRDGLDVALRKVNEWLGSAA